MPGSKLCTYATIMLTALVNTTSAMAQRTADIDFQSVGRAAPLPVAIPGPLRTNRSDLENYPAASFPGYPEQHWMVGPFAYMAPGPDGQIREVHDGTAFNGDSPPGIDPLEVDIFTTRDFYQDKALWSDPRYFRCNSSAAIEQTFAAGSDTMPLAGDNPPATAAWGHCDRDYPREAIISPYGFSTAAAHYAALLQETEQRGGPTEHSYATLPNDWNGRFVWPRGQNWYAELFWNQIPTILSLLTDEYQTRMVQEAYHHGSSNTPMWPAQYCWPEGFMRRWHYHGVTNQPHSVLVTPKLVQFLAGDADNFITNIHIGRSFNLDDGIPRLGADVPRWYGETIGFWDGEVLITWTSNIKGWKVHGNFEFSNQMQTIEIYTPNRDADGSLIGLNHEGIFYDPESLVEPIRMVRNIEKIGDFDTENPYEFIECTPSIFPIDGRATPVSPGTQIDYEVLDMYGRPWAQLWEKHHEQNMQRPSDEDIFSFD